LNTREEVTLNARELGISRKKLKQLEEEGTARPNLDDRGWVAYDATEVERIGSVLASVDVELDGDKAIIDSEEVEPIVEEEDSAAKRRRSKRQDRCVSFRRVWVEKTVLDLV